MCLASIIDKQKHSFRGIDVCYSFSDLYQIIKKVEFVNVIWFLLYFFHLFLASETNNEIAMDDVVENHVTDSLSSDDFPDAVDSEFPMSSPFNSLDRSAAHIEGADHEHIGNNLNVDGFLENHDESSSKEQNTEDSLPLSSTSKGKKTVPCRSSREINMELRAQIMKEIRKPGRSKYSTFLH